MGETRVERSVDAQKNNRKGPFTLIDPAFSKLLVELPQNLRRSIQSQIKRSVKDEERLDSEASIVEKKGKLSTSFELNLEKQMQAWKDNPFWVDEPPQIKVDVPKGSLCNLNVNVNVGLPPDAVYNIVTDPDNRKVFKNIKEVLSRKVLVDEGSRQQVEVEQAALWRFLWWSGTIIVHVLVDQNREDYSMKFKQVKTGFMKKFEGLWKLEPFFVDEGCCLPFKPTTLEDYYMCTGGKGRIGSKLSLSQLIQPSIVPPPPISWYLRGITARTTEMLINDLLAEAANIRGFAEANMSGKELGEFQETSYEVQSKENCDIKERWAHYRKSTKNCKGRLPWTTKHA